MTAPTIDTAHLCLRPFTPDDAEAYYEAVLSDPVTTRALPTGRPTPPQRARSILESYIDHWDEYGYGLWAVINREGGQMIGHSGLQRLDDTANVEVTYAIRHPYVTGDLPVEAVYASLRYGYETLELLEILAPILPDNEVARRVYNQLGMRPGPTIHAYGTYLPTMTLSRGDFQIDDSPYALRGDSQ